VQYVEVRDDEGSYIPLLSWLHSPIMSSETIGFTKVLKEIALIAKAARTI
jgi:hypothetical protein